MKMYVEVQVAVAAQAVNKPFHYALPEELVGRVEPGMRVEVPFGARKIQAFVLRLLDEPEVPVVKEITRILDTTPLLSLEMLQLSKWLGEYYLCSRSAVLQAMLPLKKEVRKKKTEYALLSLPPAEIREQINLLKAKAPRQARVLAYLLEKGPCNLPELKRTAKADQSVIRALQEKRILAVRQGDLKLACLYGQNSEDRGITLTPHQGSALKALSESLLARENKTFLLHGVTGSGKTEIYLRIIEKSLQQGRGAMVLVPEISLTAQMIQRFQDLFGSRVALLHSKLSQGERYHEWTRLLTGEACIAIGPRSAVFAPVRNLGVIVLDEEHERTYKQEETPRYHAGVVARERARMNSALVVLGSATPSLESYERALRGHYTLLTLPRRVEERPMPPVTVVDMREEMKAGNRKMFSRQLLDALAQTMAEKQKALLFLNRRGHSTCVLCRECGLVLRCPYCDISLTYHSQDTKLLCHYCSYTASIPDTCPKCGSVYIKYFGTGTQRVEEQIRTFFPETGIWRMDTDTTSRKGSHSRILRAFQKKGPAILIGTQMIAKGLDIAGITLVGVITADVGLNLPDFRAGERTFQLLTQVAGRTGRGSHTGRVIVQSYSPEHYAIKAAKNHDYETFYHQEIKSRQELGYPPFSNFIRLIFMAEDEKALSAACGEMTSLFAGYADVEFLGPVQCPFSKVADSCRWHVVLKGKEKDKLRACAREIGDFVRGNYSTLHMVTDVDPLNML